MNDENLRRSIISPALFNLKPIAFKRWIMYRIKNPRRKQRGIEDFSLKSLLMRGNISPAPPVVTAPRGGVSDPKEVNALLLPRARLKPPEAE
jgi:hypothetical protein